MHAPILKLPLLAAISLIAAPMLPAEQEKPAPAAAKKQQPRFIGLWESSDQDMHVDIQADGRIFFILMIDSPLVGAWKQGEADDQLKLSLTREDEKMEVVMTMSFEGEDKATFTVEGEPQTFTRVRGKIDEEKLLGTWKSTEKDEEEDTLSHYIIIREKGGKGVCKSMEIWHKKKIYCLDEEPFEWRTAGGLIIEHYDAGTPEQSITAYGNIKVTPDKITFGLVGDDEFEMEDIRTEDTKLPQAPEGYEKVTADAYWEALYGELD